MADEVTNARWKKSNNPNDFHPVDAVRVFLGRVERGEIDPIHVIVCFAEKSEDGGTLNGIHQTGSYDIVGSVGLLARSLALLNKDI